ncbi:hypothetical protein [Mesorhizobium sp. M00.F.Ca.ET.217.01.1.1]|uniref:hypothetical protein n=1 Tax=Mesorhizobium sp. M00.F.Ca.ET.217.01.1.1 TaxID=2500529 RepID=UPI000FD70D45|nr:hypothetical protein [Mesorhizobium sp. M00.F.Ca.ET.217.01.1.1]TGQ19312.1 hypothetical protein EN860_019485 [Mesorhizobium sp. M00.F.Ca.ET.217.01.1.1]TIU11791.1 MAG: hypothetical protein E5W44_09585 [Mesorhizobium sp.]
MARPRTPKTKAKVTGQAAVRRKKFEERAEPKIIDPLGEPYAWIVDTDKSKAREAWEIIRKEIPWLNSSHRILVAEASNILGRMIAGAEVGVQAMNLLRQCLGQMGATPADASKAGAKPDGESSEDPAAKYFD